MRPNKRLTIVRTTIALIAISSTTFLITNLLVEIGYNEKDSTSLTGGSRQRRVPISLWTRPRVDSTKNSTTNHPIIHPSTNGSINESKEYESLRIRVDGLHRQLTRMKQENLQLRRQLEQQQPHVIQWDKHLFSSIFNEDIVHQKLTSSEVINGGQSLKTEYELTPFARFTMNRIYLVEPGLQKRVLEKPIGFKKRSLDKIINSAVEWLNNNRNLSENRRFENFRFLNLSLQPRPISQMFKVVNTTNPGSKSIVNPRRYYETSDFLEGIYRTVPGLTEHYELHFRDLDTPNSYRTISVARIFSSPLVISSKLQSVTMNLIHIIVPLQGRVVAFQQFMDKFEDVCVRGNENVFITIVHFGGGKEFNMVNNIVSNLKFRTGFQNIRTISLTGEFSRGKALTAGAADEIPMAGEKDVLLFFCDVDIIFTSDFLQRCRLNAESDVRVYYPILFSLYNPNITNLSDDFSEEKSSPLRQERTSFDDKSKPYEFERRSTKVITISVDSGFWRDFGYGMTCQYLSDFRKSGGFDADHKGWGMEDVFLYRKYVKSPLLVVRATDPGILHVWHDKTCAKNLPLDQYKSCIRSKALNEASHAQLGMLLFRKEIDDHSTKMSTNRS